MKKLHLFLMVVLVVGGVWWFSLKTPNVVVTSFEECAAAGNPIAESYPATCRTKEGKVFTEDIGNELEKIDLIRVDSPRPNTLVSSPLKITGQARGTWFFEASFPARILDSNGVELGVVPVQALGEWMTTDFVSFSTELKFDAPQTKTGKLILEKDNPSGLPENNDSLIVPIKFED